MVFTRNSDLFRTRSKLRSGKSFGFSLVEMIIVLALVGMLLAISAPSILTLQSATLTTSARQLSGYLNLARSEAIRDGRVVRVAVVRDWPGKPDSALRMLSSWKWSDEEEKFIQFGEWQILPSGIVLEPRFPSYVKGSSYAKSDATTVKARFPSADRTLDILGESVRVSTFDFMPNGRVRQRGENPGRMVGFVLVQGSIDKDGQVVRVGAKGANGNPPNWAQVNVDALTGRIQVHRP